jgi:hypothetical protein
LIRGGLAGLVAVARRWRLRLVVVTWAIGVLAIIATVPRSVVVVHWANGHMVERDALFPAFAREFNGSGRRTASGKPIRVQVVPANSGEITGELVSRVAHGTPLDRGKANPTLVTPAADHWLSEVNRALGRDVVDLDRFATPATTYIGIVTTRELARCMGWPEREIGLADVVALATGAVPEPPAAARCAPLREARVAFTYPTRSSTARSVLYSLHAIVAGKPSRSLTDEDVSSPAVGGYVSAFQNAIGCYVPDTLDLSRKILSDPACAQFYFLAEDNLVKLYQGKVEVRPGERKGLERDLVMVYPKEGAIVHNHSAFVVRAPWVAPEQAEAADVWIAFLREETQQQALMQEGFRRGTAGACVDPLGSPFRPCATQPGSLIYPDRIDASVAAQVNRNWR